MLRWVSSFLALGPAIFAQGTGALDPVRNFCRIWDHQSTVKNGNLYVDGGLEIFVQNTTGGNQTETTGYNTALLQIDLTNSWNWKTNLTVNSIKKGQNPDTGTDAPLFVRSALYNGLPNDTSFYLYGGTVSYANTSFPGWQQPITSQYALWSYSVTDETWSQYDVSLDVPNRPNSGAFAEAPDLGLGFYLNGEIDSGSQNSVESMKNFRAFLPGLVVVDTVSHTAKNLSTDALKDTPRARHRAVYVPGIGEKGALVTFGGVTKSVYDGSASSRGTYLSMANIDIFDVASIDDSSNTTNAGSWYRQQATGDIPDPRADYCLVGATAPDNSSYNIYMYGGRDRSQAFDQVYVLSLPSFKWMKLWEGDSPRWGHTCHAVGNSGSQMITVGGVPDTDFTNGCDWETKGVSIYDMSSGLWGSVYNAFDGEYQIPSAVSREIGGSARGNATTTTPIDGFSSQGLATLFNSSSTSTSNDSHHGISKGAIAGAVVGSVIGAAILAAALLFLLLRYRRRQQAIQQSQQKPLMAVNDGDFGALQGQKTHWPVEADSQQGRKPPVELGSENGLHEAQGRDVYEVHGTGVERPRHVVELP